MGRHAVLPRVVLVEDDLAMQLYAETALRELPVELVCCTSVAQALAVLGDGPAALVITDLMLPGESGIGLIERLRAEPERYAPTRVVVTSAALDAGGVRARLAQLGVWRMLPKPMALDALESCVIEALREPSLAPPETARPLPHAEAIDHPDQTAAVDAYFGGDAALHAAYRAACLQQFSDDAQWGDTSIAADDWPDVRRLAHNLRSVLMTLGEVQAAAMAERLEACVLRSDRNAALGEWCALRAQLLRLAQLR